jgi:hypothetical protein
MWRCTWPAVAWSVVVGYIPANQLLPFQESELSTVQSCSYPCPRRINRSALLRADFYCGELFLFGPTRHTLSVVLHLCTP